MGVLKDGGTLRPSSTLNQHQFCERLMGVLKDGGC
jgi:hypothetical protein